MGEHVDHLPGLGGRRGEARDRRPRLALRRGLDHRGLPEAAEQRVSAPPGQQNTASVAHEQRRCVHFFHRLRLREQGQAMRLVFPAREARGRERTNETERIAREADRRPELHQRLVERPGRVVGHRLARDGPDLLLRRGPPHIVLEREHPREHPDDVAVDERCADAVREARDRPRRVRSDAADAQQLVDRARHLSAEARDDLGGALVQSPGAAVVPETAPEREHVCFGRLRERLQRGKTGQKSLEIGDDGGDARLLEHDLADPHAVPRAVVTPGEITRLGAEPRCQERREIGRERRPRLGKRAAQSFVPTYTWLTFRVENPAG